jgi:hypothetical protein
MNKQQREKRYTTKLRQAFLCHIGYHDQALSDSQITALDGIVMQTGVPQLISKLASVFEAQDFEKANELIATIESLGIKPAGENLEVVSGSPIDIRITAAVTEDRRLADLRAYVATTQLSPEASKVAA